MTTATLGTHRHPADGRWTPARKGFAAWRRKTALAAERTVARAAGLRRLALTVTGLGFVDAAAYQVTVGVGLLATGASVLVLEWLSSTD